MDHVATNSTGQARTIRSVLATVPFPPDKVEILRKAVAPASFTYCDPKDAATIARALETADVAIIAGDLDDRHVAAPNLKWVHCDHSGLTKSARPDVFAKGMIVTGSAGRSAAALAQHGFYFALALTFEVRKLLHNQAHHIWRGIPGFGDKQGLVGRTLGIVGFGHTGKAMAALGNAFGMTVIVYTRSQPESAENVDVLLVAEAGDSKDRLVEEADVVMLATQLTDATFHLFSTEEFARMKNSAVIINMARGPVIDEDALLVALRSGQIAGAGLDARGVIAQPIGGGQDRRGALGLAVIGGAQRRDVNASQSVHDAPRDGSSPARAACP